ncbi:peptidoglycan DD-metalloendopeptidase family protein [Thermocrinis sp.]
MREYISIIVVQHEGKPPKTIRIRKSYLKAFFIFACTFLFISLIAYIFSLSLLSEKAHLSDRLKKLEEQSRKMAQKKQELSKERDLLTQKLKSLEASLMEIESYLSQRGVRRKVASVAVGGPSYQGTAYLDVSRLEFLENRAQAVLTDIRSIPLGYPVYGKINSHLGWRKNPFGKGYEFHTGIDIDAPVGALVRATADGVVYFAGKYGEYGNTVILIHPSGYTTLYAHLSEIEVKPGQEIKAGQVLGKVGSTGRSTGSHLHYEVILDGKYLNPLDFLVLK